VCVCVCVCVRACVRACARARVCPFHVQPRLSNSALVIIVVLSFRILLGGKLGILPEIASLAANHVHTTLCVRALSHHLTAHAHERSLGVRRQLWASRSTDVYHADGLHISPPPPGLSLYTRAPLATAYYDVVARSRGHMSANRVAGSGNRAAHRSLECDNKSMRTVGGNVITPNSVGRCRASGTLCIFITHRGRRSIHQADELIYAHEAIYTGVANERREARYSLCSFRTTQPATMAVIFGL